VTGNGAPDSSLWAYFWSRAANGDFVAQQCASCGKLFFYPRGFCPECLCEEYDWTVLAGPAVIISHTTVWRAAHADFAASLPYTIGLIEHAPRVRTLGLVSGATADDDLCDRRAVLLASSPETGLRYKLA
jgi:uncharacterized OB-fold protein